jgi:hypothetical protein
VITPQKRFVIESRTSFHGNNRHCFVRDPVKSGFFITTELGLIFVDKIEMSLSMGPPDGISLMQLVLGLLSVSHRWH